jgi:2-C-methyl-D-erythritol 2,4-cyclodiphosphate synthase
MLFVANTNGMLTIQHLRKSFGPLVAVDDVSFAVTRGTLVGLLGPNGAGKTTTVSMIAGLIAPDKGDVLVEGARLNGDTDPKKRRIGLVPQDLALYDELSARANLRFFGALYSLSGAALDTAIKNAMDLVGLSDRLNDRVATYSGGMKRRLNLAAGLLHDPDILLLDEPTVGVDPQSRNAIFDNLETLKARGKALIYTTHYMEEVERLADRIVVIDHGSVIAEGDIGVHFPPSDARWRGVASEIFLKHAASLIRERGGEIVHADVTLICEAPRIGPYRDAMRAAIGAMLGFEVGQISIKATTNEGLGFIGRGEGIAAIATATVSLP